MTDYSLTARGARACLPVAVLLATVAGCGQGTDRQAITQVRDGASPAQFPPKLTAAQRFGLSSTQTPHGHPPIAKSAGDAHTGSFEPAALVWEVPNGWQQAPARMMRVVTFTVGESECYVSVLGSAAGNLEANINRWRGQMAQPPVSPEEIASLPKVPVLGQEASMVTIEGTYTGMGGASKPGQMMLGLVCPLEQNTLFVKMIGPEEEVKAHAENFAAFCRSLGLGSEAAGDRSSDAHSGM